MVVETIYLCQHSHSDAGYTDLAYRVRNLHAGNMAKVIEYCQRYADRPDEERFRWSIEAAYVLDDFLPQADARQQECMYGLLRKRSIELTGFHLSIISHHLSLGELRESIRWAVELSKANNFQVKTAMLCDVGSATWALPEVLQQAGIKYFVLGAGGCRVLCPWADLPPLFRWVGPRGSSVLFWHLGLDKREPPNQITNVRAQYGLGTCGFVWPVRSQRLGQGVLPQSDNEVLANIAWASLDRLLERLEAEGYPYQELLLQCASDNSGPDPEICNDIRFWNELHPNGPKVRLATFSEFLELMERKYGPDIPSLKGDLTCTWMDQAASLPQATSLHGRTGRLIEQTKALAELTGELDKPLGDQMHQVYRKMLWYTDHTYGLSSWGLGKTLEHGWPSDSLLDFHKASWRTKTGYAQAAYDQAKAIFEQLAVRVENSLIPPEADFVVLNPHDHSRVEPIEAIIIGKSDCSYQIRDLQNGQVYAADTQPVASVWSRLTFVAELGPGEIHLYRAEELDHSASCRLGDGQIIDNGIYSVQLDQASGWVKRITDLKNGRELLDSEAEHQFGQVLHAILDGVRDDAFYAGICSAITRTFAGISRVDTGSTTMGQVRQTLRSRVVLNLLGQQTTVHLEVNLFRSVPNIYVRVSVDKPLTTKREDVRIAFPLNICRPMVHYRLANCVARMNQDQLPGSHTDYLTVQDWINVAERDYHITLTALDAPLVEVGGIRAEKWAGLDYVPEKGWLYSYVADNIYQTNIPQWTTDQTSFEFVISAIARPFVEEDIELLARGVRTPMCCLCKR